MNKEKREGKLKTKIKEMKETSKGKAILKLILWVIFFFILLIFCLIATLISPPKNNTLESKDVNQEEIQEDSEIDPKKTIKKLQENLVNSNYDYIYEINVNGYIYTFEGNKTKGIDKGYKTTSFDIIKYYIDTTGIYQEVNNELNLITNLYDGVEQNYLDLNYLFNILNTDNLEEIPCDCEYDIYGYNDTINNYTIAFALHLENEKNYITNIKISNNMYTYDLTFRNVEVNK